jgi:hypothetical protein
MILDKKINRYILPMRAAENRAKTEEKATE